MRKFSGFTSPCTYLKKENSLRIATTATQASGHSNACLRSNSCHVNVALGLRPEQQGQPPCRQVLAYAGSERACHS